MRRFKRATGWRLWILDRLGAAGLTLPWRIVWVHPDYDTEQLRAHEQVHLDQIDRHGPVRFAALYIWFLIRYGYRNHPFEREAYGKHHDHS